MSVRTLKRRIRALNKRQPDFDFDLVCQKTRDFWLYREISAGLAHTSERRGYSSTFGCSENPSRILQNGKLIV